MGKDRKSKKGKHEEDFGEEGVDNEQVPREDESSISQASTNKRRKAKKKDEETDDMVQKVEELSLDISSAGQKSKSLNKKGDKRTEDIAKNKESDSEDDEKETKKSNKKAKKSGGKKGKVDDDDDSVIDNYSKPNKKKGRRAKDETDEDEDLEDGNKSSKKKPRGKKGNLEISDEDEQSFSKEVKTNKKTKKVREDASNEHQEITKVDSKTSVKKNKESINKSNIVDDDDDSQKVSKKKNKKDAKKSREITESDDDDASIKKNIKPKSVFELLAVEDVDMGISDDEDSDKEVEKVVQKVESKPKKQISEEQDEQLIDKSKEGGKKSKKKEKRRKQDDEDEEVQKMLEELALEIEGKKPPAPEKEGTPESVEQEMKSEEQDKSSKQKKKKKKKGETDVQPDEKDVGDVESVADGEKEEQGVKTAAQKKKEKKEREKQKKLSQNAQERKKTKDVPEEAASEILSKPSETKIADIEIEAASVPDEDAALDEDDDADSKKKKKKKKKGEEEDKKDKKRPGKKQILAMQEALKKMKEEEEKRRLEEEAKRLAAEEAERKRQEQLRLEQERKERKKQKEKEKRERLKAEGKLLTKAQKQARARMEATLSALRLQGVEVPQIGEKRERAPRLGDRRKSSKKKSDEPQLEQKEMSPTEESQLQKIEVEIVSATENEEKKDDDKEESIKESWEDDEEDVKEAWDETTDDDGEEDGDKECSTPEDAVSQPSLAKKEESDESEEEDEEESESEEDDSEEESSEESNDEEDKKKEKVKEKVYDRIQRRRDEAEKKRSTDKLRSPVVCVLGHVDTGKTKILDKIRRTHVQDNEAGGITQQIGATMVPQEALKEQCKMVKNFPDMEVKLPGLLIIDTPGHESFSNLRSRGSSLCDIAILVVDIMHGLEPQTLESINLLKQKKTPFVVALNKIDRLYDWKSSKNKDVQDVIKSQARNTKIEFEERVQAVVLQFAEQALNAALSYENKDTRTYISMVPTSAFTGEGMGNLMALIVELSQTMMAKRLAFSEELQATVLEVKAIPGLGTTIDVILVNGRLREGDTIVVAGQEGPVVTQIRSLLMPEPLKELRVKNPYNEYKEVEGAQGVKIAGKDLEKAIAGLQLLVAYQSDEVELLKEEVANSLRDAINSIKLAERGVYVQASTLGSLEALLDFLRSSKIPYSGVKIGPVVKKDVMKASIMLEHEAQYAVILAFDVKVERDAEELADSLGVKIFQANIIYHLFDRFTAYQDELQQKKRDEYKHVAVFPCKLRILPQYIFNSRDPIVVGVSVEAGVIREGTPLCVPSREFLEIGTVTTLELNHKTVEVGRKGQELCIKIEPVGGESPKMYGRHFDNSDILVSKISRQSIDACKNYFRDDLQKSDWQLMVELKKLFQIM